MRPVIAAPLFALLAAFAHAASPVRVTTWNLEWFPGGSRDDATPQEQQQRIARAADVLRPLNSDVLVLQEIRDYAICERLAEAIRPNTYKVAICSSFKEPFQSGFGRQQVAILAKEFAQAAWAEPWKSVEGVDPPRGFAFAWYRIAGNDIGIYSVHLKSNLVRHGNKDAETAKNIRKRESAIAQLVDHVTTTVKLKMPAIKAVVVAGDLNTNADQAMFAAEKTLKTLVTAGFRDCLAALPLMQRVTHPANHGYPPATFDYVWVKDGQSSSPLIVSNDVSDHYPLTCDISVAPAVTTNGPAR